jgi:alpha-D-ribose 1-methylphosphonate 5-triphosphate synthase subunit PhnI
MYVAAKGGEKAIENAHRLLAHERRGDPSIPELSLEQIKEQLRLAVDRVMCEGSLYDRELAAVAIKQARGDLSEAIFLRDDSGPAHLGGIQGFAWRPGSRPDFRLYA